MAKKASAHQEDKPSDYYIIVAHTKSGVIEKSKKVYSIKLAKQIAKRLKSDYAKVEVQNDASQTVFTAKC